MTIRSCMTALAGALIAVPAMANDFSGVLEKINLPDGFKIEVFAEMPKARSIEVAKPNGVVFVGSRTSSATPSRLLSTIE